MQPIRDYLPLNDDDAWMNGHRVKSTLAFDGGHVIHYSIQYYLANYYCCFPLSSCWVCCANLSLCCDASPMVSVVVHVVVARMCCRCAHWLAVLISMEHLLCASHVNPVHCHANYFDLCSTAMVACPCDRYVHCSCWCDWMTMAAVLVRLAVAWEPVFVDRMPMMVAAVDHRTMESTDYCMCD